MILLLDFATVIEFSESHLGKTQMTFTDLRKTKNSPLVDWDGLSNTSCVIKRVKCQKYQMSESRYSQNFQKLKNRVLEKIFLHLFDNLLLTIQNANSCKIETFEKIAT